MTDSVVKFPFNRNPIHNNDQVLASNVWLVPYPTYTRFDPNWILFPFMKFRFVKSSPPSGIFNEVSRTSTLLSISAQEAICVRSHTTANTVSLIKSFFLPQNDHSQSVACAYVSQKFAHTTTSNYVRNKNLPFNRTIFMRKNKRKRFYRSFPD